MYDGFKTWINNPANVVSLHSNPRLEFCQITDINSGEVLSCKSDNYKGLKIETFPSGFTEIKGSFHKYKNGGTLNFDDFTYKDLIDVMGQLQNELGINLNTTRIVNLEFGVNIQLPFDANSFINALLCYKWKQFNLIDVIGPGYGKQCKAFEQYWIKIYNKALQNFLDRSILRIEKKITTMSALKFGHLYLSDLTNHSLWEHCKCELLAIFDHILINEPIDINNLSKNEQRIYNKVINQSNWVDFSKDQRKRNKKSFNQIIDKYGKGQYRVKIVELIRNKCDELHQL